MAECTKTTRKNMINNIVDNILHNGNIAFAPSANIFRILSRSVVVDSNFRSCIHCYVRRKVDILVLEQVADELIDSILKNLPK